MPYIPPRKRDRLQVAPGTGVANDAGELNYQLAYILDDFIKFHGLCYASLNEVVGVLECLKLEVYRRIAAPYEDGKIQSNGDVFTCLPKK